MTRGFSKFAAGGCLALALGTSARAAPAITAAAIATGRLYVVGTTDQPHTSVSLDGKFTAESDDKGKFQFELVYYPAGCVVRATIGGNTVEAKVQQCGEICMPVLEANAPPASKLSSPKPPSGRLLRAPTPPVRPHGIALAAPEAPATTSALKPPALAHPQPKAGRTAEPIPHHPLPAQRPTEASKVAAKRRAPAAVVEPPATKPQLRPKPPQQVPPNDQSPVDQPDAPEGSDVY